MATPRIGVAAVVRARSGQFLLGRRLAAHGAGKWQFPGGHLEFGEDPMACATRETLEETGLHVDAVGLLGVTNDVFSAEHKHYLTVFVLCRRVDETEEPRNTEPDKCAGWHWKDWSFIAAHAARGPDAADGLFLPMVHLVEQLAHPPWVALEGIKGGREDEQRGDDRRRYDDRRDNRRDDRDRSDRPGPGPRSKPPQNQNASSSSAYVTEEELSRRFVDGEEAFVLRQSKKKADIRVRERRAKPIDLLAFTLRWVDTDRDAFDDEPGDAAIVVPRPEAVVASVAAAAASGSGSGAGSDWTLDALEKDIQSFLALDANTHNRAYWKALLVLCGEAKRTQQTTTATTDEGDRVLGAVAADIDRILAPKTLAELEALERQIAGKLRAARDGDEAIDTDYWGQLLRRLRVWKAKAAVAAVGTAAEGAREEALKLAGGGENQTDDTAEEATGDKRKNRDDDQESSPKKPKTDSTITTTAPGTQRFALAPPEDLSQATQALYDREVARGVGEDEEVFAEEVLPPPPSSASAHKKTAPAWADKYRPRKPRYYNRVQMGYEWNKYNQTHYDHDNPPPKVVQGYKFNIFYPELIDPSKTPTYHITREGGRRKGESFAPAGEEDTCLIRFSAGPPYEDIAFRIVDREWDYSGRHHRGFKSVFEKGILQLHFQFKKVYYRK